MSKNLSRRIVVLAALCIIWAAATWTGYADLRIVEHTDGERMETLYKGNRIAAQLDVGLSTVFMCETGEFIMMSSSRGGRYWQGDIAAYQEELNELYQESADLLSGLGDFSDFGDFGDLGDMGALFGELFGGGNQAAEEIHVKVTKVGEDTVAGYAAEHYIVETGSGNDWRVYEEIWVSTALFDEIAAEVGACVDFMLEISEELSAATGGFAMDEIDAVLASPEYQALMERGYPVRVKQSIRGLFGQTTQSLNEVIEVNRDPILEDAFVVPSGYRRVDHFFEVFEI